MELLTSLDEYKQLLVAHKKLSHNGYNNNFLSLQSVKRYIKLKRIFFNIQEDVLYFFTDEEKYYRLYVQTPFEYNLNITATDKPILLRNIYNKDFKKNNAIHFEQHLQHQGFGLYYQSEQILAKPMDMKQEVQTKCKKGLSFLERFGFTIGYANIQHIPEIISIRNNEVLLKDYHFFYETIDEIQDNINKGFYRCAFNADGSVCAVQQFSIENNVIQGKWLAVKDEYKTKYGIGTAMAYHSFMYAINKNINCYLGWITTDNEQSIKYHKSIGYKLTGKYADEWVLLPK